MFLSGEKVLILDELEDVECLEGDTVTFRCRICPSDYIGIKWYLDETLLYTNELNEIQLVPGGYHTLTFRQLARKDTGTISFAAGDKRTYASLLVRGEFLICQSVLLWSYFNGTFLISSCYQRGVPPSLKPWKTVRLLKEAVWFCLVWPPSHVTSCGTKMAA